MLLLWGVLSACFRVLGKLCYYLKHYHIYVDPSVEMEQGVLSSHFKLLIIVNT